MSDNPLRDALVPLRIGSAMLKHKGIANPTPDEILLEFKMLDDALTGWLGDHANHANKPVLYHVNVPPSSGNGFEYSVVRKLMRLNDGTSMSLQQSATHYCAKEKDTFEVWHCPPHECLDPYGFGDHPYSHVPRLAVLQYIAAHGGIAADQTEQETARGVYHPKPPGA